MSDDTQNRLKAFLARNRSRINGPGADTSDISNAYFSGSSTKTDADKLDMIQNISHSTKFHENSNKTLAQSLDEKRSGREFEGVSFEYQPISLFDVIGNTPYSEAHDSTRNNSILQSEQVRVQGHDLYSVVNTSPGRQSDRNAEYESQLASFRRHENDVISNEEHNNAMANTNKPVSVSKSSKKDTVSGKKTSPSKDVKKETSSSPSGAKVQTNSQAVKDIKEQASNNKVEPEKPQQQQLQQQEQQPPVIEKVEEIKGRTGSMSFNGSIKGGSQVFEEAEPIVNYQPPKENKVVEVERRQNSPEIEKKKSVSPAKKVKEGNSGGSGEKVKGVFSESSKKLNALNDNAPNDSEFKKEIKNLIKVIKQEKEQVVEELKLMAEDLNKYKSAFKKLQKQKGTKPSDPGFSSPKRDSVENKKSFSPERQGPSSGNKSNRAASPSQKSPDKGGFENIQGLDLKDLISASELKKDPINEFVIKDMNLNPKLFFKDEERLATDPNIKPTIVDLVASQREIINFLVKRYQTAEHNRLKTEEQASKVVLSLENAVKKLDKKDSLSRTRTSLSPINSRRRVNMTDQI